MMRHSYIAILISLFSVVTCTHNGVINFTEHGSRFGDNLLGYIKARWVAFQHDLPCYLTPFPYSNELYIEEKNASKKPSSTYKNKITLHKKKVVISHYTDTLFRVSFRSKEINWSVDAQNYDFITFRRELQQSLRPRHTSGLLSIPNNIAPVAVHVRRGGGFDAPLLTRAPFYADKKWPLKFPPFEFYIEQIRVLYHMLDKQPLYIHIFTDDSHPEHIAELFKKALSDCIISFGYRTTKNSHNMHVIDDFFSMASFDYLIRPNSNFSVCAQLMGNHKIIISPVASKWVDNKLLITKTNVHKPSIMVSSGNKKICGISGLKNNAASDTLEFV